MRRRFSAPDFAGVLVRDGWVAYRGFKKAPHQSCLAHLLRRCKDLQAAHPEWAGAVQAARARRRRSPGQSGHESSDQRLVNVRRRDALLIQPSTEERGSSDVPAHGARRVPARREYVDEVVDPAARGPDRICSQMCGRTESASSMVSSLAPGTGDAQKTTRTMSSAWRRRCPPQQGQPRFAEGHLS